MKDSGCPPPSVSKKTTSLSTIVHATHISPHPFINRLSHSQPLQHNLLLRLRIPKRIPPSHPNHAIHPLHKILSVLRRARLLPSDSHVNRTRRRINIVVQHWILSLFAGSPGQTPTAF